MRWIFFHTKNICTTYCNIFLSPLLQDLSQSSIPYRVAFTFSIQGEYFAYDVISFSSYAKGIENLEWGYNRDKERLPQINMALYVGQTSQLPVFYLTYQGSIVDKSHLRYMMAFNDELGISGVSFILDCAFCNTINLEYMREKGYVYIAAVEIRHKATKARANALKIR